MKWVEDELAKARLIASGLTFAYEEIDQERINRKLSRNNTARQLRLDRDHASGIALSIARGDPIPAIVVRQLPNGTLVIAGGNHRDEACLSHSIKTRYAYVVSCTDAEFIILCRSLNCVVGRGADRDTRIRQAADAVENKMLTQKDAANEFNVSSTYISKEIRSRQAIAKARSVLPGAKMEFSKDALNVLGNIKADAVFKRAVELLNESKAATKKEVLRSIADSLNMPTESESIASMDLAAANWEVPKSKVRSEKRRAFLSPLGALLTVFKKTSAKRLVDLDIVDDEEEVRARCKALANLLRSL